MILKKKLFLYILITILILITIILAIVIYMILYKNYDTYDTFNSPQTTSKPYNDGTQLYGSIFLDNLKEVITNMTDPPIKYDTKRIELVRYSDVLL